MLVVVNGSGIASRVTADPVPAADVPLWVVTATLTAPANPAGTTATRLVGELKRKREKEKWTQLIKLTSRENVFIVPSCLVAPVYVLAELVSTCSTDPWHRKEKGHGCRCLKNLRTTRRLNGYSLKLTPNFLCHFCATV